MKTSSTKTTSKNSKPTNEQITTAKMFLAQWGKHQGEISPQGLRVLGQAVQTLKKAYNK